MSDLAVMWDWVAFAVRWTHVIVGIAWIGSSFYFIALDLSLRPEPGAPQDVAGAEWQVHGGGFYHIRKYLVAPEAMPEHLTWFKWESYSTWLSGAALLIIIYWLGAELYLIDPEKADLLPWQAIVLSAASLSIGWLVYDYLCKSRLGHSPTTLMLLLFVLIVVMAWGYTQVFTGRAALLHLGALTATIMSANVFFVIIPNQKIVVEDLKAGRTPAPEIGRIAKLRSTHNNYLTLPVLFLMLSNHAPLSFATEWNWLIASLTFLMGVTIRHFFNTMHAGKGHAYWTWPATAIIFLAIMWLSTAPPPTGAQAAATDHRAERFASDPAFPEVQSIVMGRCSMCHAREPFWQGVRQAPKGVYLETGDDVATHARQIFLQSAVSHAMPPANLSLMERQERAIIAEWYRRAR
jgi:uncharacterized membrane protein